MKYRAYNDGHRTYVCPVCERCGRDFTAIPYINGHVICNIHSDMFDVKPTKMVYCAEMKGETIIAPMRIRSV